MFDGHSITVSEEYSQRNGLMGEVKLPKAASELATGASPGFRAGDIEGWKKRRRESEVEKAHPSLVSPWLHDLHSFVLRVLTDGLNGAL